MTPIPSAMLSALVALFFGAAAAAQGWLGVFVDPDSRAPRVRECVPGSPAEKAGLAAGDGILAFDGKPVATVDELTALVRGCAPGVAIAVRITRSGVERTVTVAIGERPAQGGVPPEPASPREAAAPEANRRPAAPPPGSGVPSAPGAEVASPAQEPGASSADLRPRLGFTAIEEHGGLRVLAVEKGSPAARAGLVAGDRILAVDGCAVERHEDLRRALASGLRGEFAVRRAQADVVVSIDCVAPVARTAAAREPAGDAEWFVDLLAAARVADERDLPLFVLFGADGDGETQTQKRTVDGLRRNGGLAAFVLAYVDRAADPTRHAESEVKTLPTLELRRGGRLVWRHEGYLPASTLRSNLRAASEPGESAGPRAPSPAPKEPSDLRAEVERLRAEVRALELELERWRRAAGSGSPGR